MQKIKIAPREHDVLEVFKSLFLLMGIGCCSVSSDDMDRPLDFSLENAALFKVGDKHLESPLFGETYEEIIADLFPIIIKYSAEMMGSVDNLVEYGEFNLTLSLDQGEFKLGCYYDVDATEEDGHEFSIGDLIGDNAAADEQWIKMKNLLEGSGITSICLEFSGGGDSGGVDYVSYEPTKRSLPTEAQKFIESHLEAWAYDRLNIGFDGNLSVSGSISISKQEGEGNYTVSCSKSESYQSSDSATAVLQGPMKKPSVAK